MKLNTVVPTIIAAAGLTASTANAQILEMLGSDTLGEQQICQLGPDTTDINSQGTCEIEKGVTLSILYRGTGSSNGERAMTGTDGRPLIQEIATMSRFMRDRVCVINGGADAEGYAQSLDGLSIVRSSNLVGGGICEDVSTNQTLTIDAANLNGDTTVDPGTLGEVAAAGDTYVFGAGGVDGWKDPIRILFAGQHQDAGDDVSNKNCDSDVRRELVSDYANYFSQDCAGDVCDGQPIEHALRRADFSGTTDTFLSLLDLPDVDEFPFCNGSEFEDNDPIRSTCAAADDVCQSVGTVVAGSGSQDACTSDADCVEGELCAGIETGVSGFCTASNDSTYGVVVPIFVPEIGVSQADAYSTDGAGNVRSCTIGVFAPRPAPQADVFGDGRCPNGGLLFAGNCFTPAEQVGAALDFRCVNAFDNNFFLGRRLGTSDGRAHNLILRDQAGQIVTNNPNVAGSEQLNNAAYRIRSSDCEEITSTLQIGCLADTMDCTVGFAGRDAFTQTTAFGADVNNVAPNPPEIRQFLLQNQGTGVDEYPFARFLYLNSSFGFANITTNTQTTVAEGDQETLAECYEERLIVDQCATFAGFVTLSDNGGSCSGSGVGTFDCNEDADCPAGETCDTELVPPTDFDEAANCTP